MIVNEVGNEHVMWCDKTIMKIAFNV
jgi:hypothetical protein